MQPEDVDLVRLIKGSKIEGIKKNYMSLNGTLSEADQNERRKQ